MFVLISQQRDARRSSKPWTSCIRTSVECLPGGPSPGEYRVRVQVRTSSQARTCCDPELELELIRQRVSRADPSVAAPEFHHSTVELSPGRNASERHNSILDALSITTRGIRYGGTRSSEATVKENRRLQSFSFRILNWLSAEPADCAQDCALSTVCPKRGAHRRDKPLASYT
jgi:hypothetical protein